MTNFNININVTSMGNNWVTTIRMRKNGISCDVFEQESSKDYYSESDCAYNLLNFVMDNLGWLK